MNFLLITKKNDLSDLKLIIENLLSAYFKNKQLFFDFLVPYNDRYTLQDLKSFIKKANLANKANELKVLVIVNFELFSEIMQNALLKTLEDSKCVFVLVCSTTVNILSTVKSRCIEYYDEEYNQEILNNKLNGDDLSDALKKFLIELDDKEISREELLDQLKAICNTSVNLENNDIVNLILDAIKKLESNCSIMAVIYNLRSNLLDDV